MKGLGLVNGVFLLDGPGSDVMFWDDLRSGRPDPVLWRKEDTQVGGVRDHVTVYACS